MSTGGEWQWIRILEYTEMDSNNGNSKKTRTSVNRRMTFPLSTSSTNAPFFDVEATMQWKSAGDQLSEYITPSLPADVKVCAVTKRQITSSHE